MATARKQRGPKVDIPAAPSAPLRLGRIGIIAAVGFGIGIAWPRLAGVRLVPELPAAPASSQDLSGAPDERAPAGSAGKPVPKPPEAPAPAASPAQPPVVGEAQVTSCRDAGGGRIEHCDAVDFDRAARGKLATMEDCDDARRISGVVSVGFELDFTTERVTRVTSGKTTTLAPADLAAVLACYEKKFSNVSLTGIPHEHQRYTVFYRVELKAQPIPTAGGSEDPPDPVTPASGAATVTWDTALVRDKPGNDTKVVARLRAGTRVGVTGRSGDWYRVKYDAKGREGFVFRTAIGL
jgi:hypothetical protein